MEIISAILIFVTGLMLGLLLEMGGITDLPLFWVIGFVTGILAMVMVSIAIMKEKEN